MIRKAFTLIELLVVIAIIAILAAILFPVFAQAKQSAKQAAAISGVKQGMTSLIMYASDYDDEQPPYLWYQRADGVWLSWMEMVNPYMKNKDVYLNPGASRTVTDFSTACASTSNPTLVSHYIIPMWVNYNYWSWFNNVIMFAGYPRHPNTCTSISAWAACLSFTRAELPAEAATLVPGYFISYKRPTGPEADTQFGSSCTTGLGPYVDALQRPQDRAIQVFRDGGIYGMADGHAKWQASRAHNKDNSYKHNYSGADYPGSPYMKVIQ